MHKPIEYKVGVINELPIRIYKYDEKLVKSNGINYPYFLDGFDVTKIIGKQIETLIAFVSSENDRRGVRTNNLDKQRGDKIVNIAIKTKSIEIPWHDGLKAVSFEIAALYWLQYAVLGNSLALQISRGIIDKPLEKVASEVYWKKAILDKQLQIQSCIKIAQQEEYVINKSLLINKKGESVYTLDAAIEKARIIMQLESTTDALRIIESGICIQCTENQIVRLITPTISKNIYDAIMDMANRYRRISLQKSFNAA